MLADASGLVALLNRNEPDHDACVTSIEDQTGSLITTWPAFTEAMYLLTRKAGRVGSEALWMLTAEGSLRIADQGIISRVKMRELMTKYRDTPMALADASLVALAEDLREARILSLDSHFRAYACSWAGRFHSFLVVPSE
ncbi:MAG TPA: PIN domain-containing protein [Candidatus Dormibacteraeota bacterium]|jgi:hypothetical protein|nr:PIN domain-containing protein [Candidatus Dormibacteraeota bacterium]